MKSDQLKYEVETWKRSLEYIIEENIHLKNRLSEILKKGYYNERLEEVEYFQNQFIREDELVGIIRDDLNQIDKLLNRKVIENGEALEINNLLIRLRYNMHRAETYFTKVKLEFSNYLHEILIKG